VNSPTIEVVIAVHTTTRPIRQAVESVLAAGAEAHALVVAHEVPPSEIEALLHGLLDTGRVRVVGFRDGIRSPAGPFNHGLSIATAPFVAVLGSDDRLEPGALDAALGRAHADSADAVMLPIRMTDTFRLRLPLPRRGHVRNLDPVKDRLFARSAPFALMRRAILKQLSLSFDPAFETGEDLEFGARLWSVASTSYGHLDPAYFWSVDAPDRVSEQDVDLRRTLAAPYALAERAWVHGLGERTRRALATKMLRVSVVGAVTSRTATPEPIDAAEIEILGETRRRWLACAPAAENVLPIADRWLLDACRTDALDGTLRAAVARRKAAPLLARTLTRNPFLAYSCDSVLRRYALYARLRREEASAR